MMTLFVTLTILGTILLSSTYVDAFDVPVNASLNFQLKCHTPTKLDFLDMLTDTDMTYDFTKNSQYTWTPGSVCNANAATWPVLTGSGMTVAQLNLGPCAMLAPHLHPRATNIVVSVAGQTKTYMIQENGARLVQTTLTPGKMTIFPRASVHTMFNEGCGNNQLYSFLDSDDPGTLNLAQAFWKVGQDIGMQVFPMIHLVNNDWNATGQEIPLIGTGSQDGFESCRKRCGLDKQFSP